MGYVENIKSIMQWGNSFERQSNFPLDRTDLHISYDDAVLYAKGDGSDRRGLGKLAYIGQTITVWGLNEKGKEGVWVYSLIPHTPADENDKTLADLKPVGSTQTETAETYSAAQTLSQGLVVGQLILVSEEEVVGEQTYKAGFYIVNAPGTISALDTSTGASDEIGALTTRVTSLEGEVSTLEGQVTTLEGNRVLKSDFETYQETITSALGTKVDNTALETYKGEVTNALNDKVATGDFTTYQSQMTTALDGKVSNDALDTYKGVVSSALDGKASTDALRTLEGKVDTDIQNLTNLVSDYSGTLGDVDDRLVELEAFKETHDTITESDIIGLFTPQPVQPEA